MSSFSTYPLDKRTRQDMIVYLENANPDQLSATAWGQTTWQAAHGEGRSASSTTFHIGLRYAQGHYWTCILTRVRRQEVALEGTIIDWGTTAPNLPGVLREYQRLYLRARAPASENPQRDPSDNNGGGSGGGGGGGGNDNGPAWEKKVYKDAYGGYFYMDEDDNYCACDAQGTQVKTTTLKGRTTNPHNILLVFVNSQRQNYYLHKGQRVPCQVQQDPSTHRPFILDDKQKKRNVQVYGPMPRWKAARAQAPAQQQPSGKISSSKAPSSKAPAASAKVPTRKPLQTVQFMVDPASGRKYYIGADGKTHWA
ncbi:predicted protein [Chaetomium globosum CBS 148.51]|uniref:Uncharacterized protein n=1 Tax=Chaetomium globosum (strain ATCC 6205 / CBS 148.51 / DSM 1962 / NBRC 6347 / NRRL 1970) TaxID=306901 RepID=Q2H7D1_CHAGB|nr:uncharacterized protein CHGG_05434 [Chaetomium globosum CBS 148.51]EAQ88815.1 predicted protein [Chaetomium globosum CBS 148.51]